MIPTHGLTHIALAVRDPERSMRFYAAVFGAREYYRDDTTIQAIGPSGFDVLAFEHDEANAGKAGGIGHFGFRLVSAGDIDVAVAEVLAAGGTLHRRGEFSPGFPFAFVYDPDGYEIEIWFE
jgi:catechol 2,3-dioxygenase-like lactoylglutathione lyase family enzyme